MWLWSAYRFAGYLYENNQPVAFQIDSVEIKRLDSLERIYDSIQKPRIYPFNPDYISDYRAYVLGIDAAALKRIRAFRSRGGRFKSKRHFKEISGISDSLYEKLKPYIKITYRNFETNKPSAPNYASSKPPIRKKDINTATAEDLKKVYGIGEVLSKRIVRYRKKIGGFTIKEQLKDIYALSPEAYEALWQHFEIKNPAPVKFTINLNKADMQELQKNPYIDFDLAEKIVEHRSLKGKFKSLEDLKQIEGFPRDKYERIVLYLRLN